MSDLYIYIYIYRVSKKSARDSNSHMKRMAGRIEVSNERVGHLSCLFEI